MLNKNSRCFKCMNKLERNFKNCPICGNETSTEKLFEYALPPGTILKNRYIVGHVVSKNQKTLTYIGLDTNLESKILISEFFIDKVTSRIDSKILIKNFENEKIFEKIKTNFFNLHQTLTKLRVLPNIIKIYETFMENNTAYVIKEIQKGITFNEYLSNNYGEISWEHSKKLFLDLIKLLRYLHANKIIHSNLNPNTIYFENNLLKIIDFTNAQINNSLDLKFELTEGYSAPEQYDNKEVGTYTDVYSIAAIMYKSLTGTKPVNSKSRLSNDNLLPPNILNSTIPKNISFAISSALVLAPKLRTQTMKDFYEDLTAPPREISKNRMLKPKQRTIKSKEKLEQLEQRKIELKIEKQKEKEEKKETKTKKIIFLSFLISCSIVSFFLVIAIFLLFGQDLF